MRRVIETPLGRVEGLSEDDPAITVFRGIPYAQPPVGELRWRAPRPAQPWEGTLQAHAFAPIAPQPMTPPEEFYGHEWQVDPATPQSEDCLYANVWTPALHADGELTASAQQHPLPVMVWIHGGGLQIGTTAEKEINGAALARCGVVVVSMAYRLNAFGFFAHPDLGTPGSTADPQANFGLLDQREALRWVRRNIAAFGGDPGNITVFGQSAGAYSIMAHCCSPGSRGLFRRAILQSGKGLAPDMRRLRTLDEAQSIGVRFLEHLGARSLEQARSVDAATLLDAVCSFLPEEAQGSDWPMEVVWRMCVDGAMLPVQPPEALAAGAGRGINLLIGNTTDEFPGTDAEGNPCPEGEVGTLAFINRWQQGGGEAPYYYRFDVPMPGDGSGPFHSSDLWFSFGTLGTCWRPWEGWHYAVSDRMRRYWTRFAATGNPNGQDSNGQNPDSRPADCDTLPYWPRYDDAAHTAMRFAADGGVQRAWLPAAEQRELRRTLNELRI